MKINITTIVKNVITNLNFDNNLYLILKIYSIFLK